MKTLKEENIFNCSAEALWNILSDISRSDWVPSVDSISLKDNMRSFSMDGIIVKERSYPSESKLLYKSASGCVELINIFQVSNVNTALKYLKSKNFWVSGFDGESKKDFIKHDWKGNNVLLFGSEGYGLNHQIKKNSDFLFRININKRVESLNISNSASIVFHYLNIVKEKS